MASTIFLCSPIQSFRRFSKTNIIIKSNSNRKALTAVRATKREDDNQDYLSGKLVDKNLIVLRMRIHEMKKTSEGNYEAHKGWMDWEKQMYDDYDSMICDAMGHLQSYLMETRPCLALGMVALIAISVPTSSIVVMYNLLELIKGVSAGIHLLADSDRYMAFLSSFFR